MQFPACRNVNCQRLAHSKLGYVQAKFGYRLDDPKWAPDWLSNEQLEMLHSDIDARQVIDGEFEQILQDLQV